MPLVSDAGTNHLLSPPGEAEKRIVMPLISNPDDDSGVTTLQT